MTGRWDSIQKVQNVASKIYRDDKIWTRNNKLGYMPVIFPGFSWNNLNPRAPFNQIPRLKGRFIWEQIKQAKRGNVDILFQAMFDEVNEGTAILKIGDDQPVGGNFLTYEGLPNDFYLKLVGNAAKCLKNQISCENIPKNE